MKRFKQWLILKLGGFLSQEVVAYKTIETESMELTAFAVRRDGMTRPEQSGDEHSERKIKDHLAHDLANQLVEKGLIKFDSVKVSTEGFGYQTYYTARIRVYKNKGAVDERKDAN
jgi:hypothetical protein